MAKKSSHEMILGMLTYQLSQWESQLAMMSTESKSELEREVMLSTKSRLRQRIDITRSLIEELQVPISH